MGHRSAKMSEEPLQNVRLLSVDLTPHDSGHARLSDFRHTVHMYLRQQEYPKTRITTVNAHLLAGMHNLSTHNGLASGDSAGLSS